MSGIILLWMPLPGSAQQRLEIDEFCNYDGSDFTGEVYSFSSDDEAVGAVNRILSYVGIPNTFRIQAASVPNATAWIKDGVRHILYSRDFMLRLTDRARTDWVATAILAHEIGHHFAGHTLQDGGSRPEKELQADRFAGFVLNRMGATLDESQLAINLVSSEQGSKTHPPRRARLEAVALGWDEANKQRGASAPAVANAAPDAASAPPRVADAARDDASAPPRVADSRPVPIPGDDSPPPPAIARPEGTALQRGGTYSGNVSGTPTTVTMYQHEMRLTGQVNSGGYMYSLTSVASEEPARGVLTDLQTGGILEVELVWQADTLILTLLTVDPVTGQERRVPVLFNRE